MSTTFNALPLECKELLLHILRHKSASTLSNDGRDRRYVVLAMLAELDPIKYKNGVLWVQREIDHLEVAYTTRGGYDDNEMDNSYPHPESICWVTCPPVQCDHITGFRGIFDDSCRPTEFRQIEDYKQLEAVINNMCPSRKHDQYRNLSYIEDRPAIMKLFNIDAYVSTRASDRLLLLRGTPLNMRRFAAVHHFIRTQLGTSVTWAVCRHVLETFLLNNPEIVGFLGTGITGFTDVSAYLMDLIGPTQRLKITNLPHTYGTYVL